MITKDGFEVTKFNSGEWNVKLLDRYCKEFRDSIHWNWFKEPDIMIPIMKLFALDKVFGTSVVNKNVELIAPYLPYSRQDRCFSLGQGIPLDSLLYIIGNFGFKNIGTICLHNQNYEQDPTKKISVYNEKIEISTEDEVTLVFPDTSARKHFMYDSDHEIIINKLRSQDGIRSNIAYEKNPTDSFLICDDICDGGRTFIECARILKEEYGNDIKIELLVAHGFMTHGLDDLKKSGISKIYIYNKDSYEYLIEKYYDTDYIRLMEV